jgi:flagellin-like hook-associated protein FlgL
MSRIIPVPTTRVGDFFVRQRLTEQVQLDQLALFRLQSQVSTGRRLQLPSDDAPAALRAINLQRLLDRKDQIRTNLESSNFYLSAAETRLGSLSQLLNNIRGEALGVAGTLASTEARQTVIQQIDQALQTLVDTGNAKAQGRYLFAGSRSQTQPYEFNGTFVEYRGNDGVLRSYVDLERLVDTNVSGLEVFGGVSTPVQGTVDLNPHLTPDTQLRTINAGNGISRNAAISVTVNENGLDATSVVDLSTAVTLRDVARLIEENAPVGTVTVEITGTGLTLRTTSDSITVSEVAEGRTAHELGIFSTPGGPPTNTLIGTDLDPAVLKTTRLRDLLGTKAQGRLVSGDSNNDIVLTALQNGVEFNGVTVEFVAGATAGNEVATYDANTQTLTVQIQSGFSTASQVAAAISAEGTFTAAADYRDASSLAQSGSGTVEVTNFGVVTSGGSGQVLDTTSGLVVTNGGISRTLDISGFETVEELLNQINGADLGLMAEINAESNGINVHSRWSGADLTIGENGGTTATQLGIRTFTGDTELAALNRGVGVPPSEVGDDLLVTARDGVSMSIDLEGARTVNDVIDRINSHSANNTGTTAVLARLAANGNGIELIDSSTVTTGALTIQAVEGSEAAEYLGFLPAGQTQASANTPDADGNFVLASEDRHTLETDSVFNTLIRLRTALEQGSVEEIGRSIDRLDTDLSRVNFAAAEIGTRLQNLAVVDIRLQDENVQLQSALSQDLDVDLVEAISNLTARQYAFEASLRTAASLLQITLLNYI